MKKLFISGSSFFIEQNIEKLTPNNDDSIDIEFFFGDELNKSEFFSFVNSVGLFGNKKAAIVRNADKIKDIDEFASSLKSISESDVLFAAEAQADKISKLFKSAGFEIISEQKKSTATYDDVKNIFKNKGLLISSTNAQKILDKSGGDLTSVSSEAEKLEMYLADKDEKSVDNLMEYVSGEKEDSIYDMVDAFAQKNVKRVLEIYSTISDNYENNLKIFFGLSKRMTDIYFSYIDNKLLSDKFDFVRRKINDQKRFWSRTEAAKMIGYMSELDTDIKSGVKLFEDAIPELISSINTATRAR